MSDPLFARFDEALQQAQDVRHQHRVLLAHGDGAIRELKRSILESASARAEIRAQRENRTETRAEAAAPLIPIR
jgi:hypothetical protein